MASVSLQPRSLPCAPCASTGPAALRDGEQGTQGLVHCTPAVFCCQLVRPLGTSISHAAPVVLGAGAPHADLPCWKSLRCECLTRNGCAVGVLAHRVRPAESQRVAHLAGSCSILCATLGVAALRVTCWEPVHQKCPAGRWCVTCVLVQVSTAPTLW